MNAETIGLLIKWGPLAVIGVVFLYYFLGGVIRGTYRVTRRLSYVILFIALIWIFIDPISNFVLDFEIPYNDMGSVRSMIVEFVENNETINDFLKYSPDLKSLILEHPEIIANPLLFIVLVVVVLPLSFPIYWIYMLIWNLVARFVFKRKKYVKDEEGNIVRNEKGKKVKVERKKRRLLGGLINGVKGAVVFSTVLMPVNFINRIYNKAKDNAELENGETLCDSLDFAEINSEICGYIDLYNESIIAKMSGEKSLDKLVSDSLTSVEINDYNVSLESEVSDLAVTVVLLNDSGLLRLLVNGVDLDTLDLSTINFDKINAALDVLFGSRFISGLVNSGVDYVLKEVLNDNLVELLKDEDIVSKLSYENATQIRDELKNVVNVIKYAVEKNVDNVLIDNRDNAVDIINNINEEDVGIIVNKLLSLRIISKSMPSALKAYAEEYGVNVPESMTDELNNEISSQLVNAIRFVKTMDATSLEDITEGNLLDNLTNLLFVNGALKEDSKESLATLLHELNSSYMFKDVVSIQVNKLLEDKNYKVDARVLKYVDSKEAWLKELTVLEKGYSLYKDYEDTETIYYEKVTGLLNEVSGTKVMLSILPFAYDELLPKVGIEINSEGLPVIDFDTDNENSSKQEFYETWEGELLVLKNIADAAGTLKLQSLEDINVDLLDKEENVDALSTVMGEVYKSDMLREPVVDYMKDIINDFVKEFGIEFSKAELLSIDTSEKWKNEFSNINEVLSIDFNDSNNINSTNLELVFGAVDDMRLFDAHKVQILEYAIRKSNFLTEDEFNEINWPSDDASIEEIDVFYDRETSILVNIVDDKDTITNLQSQELKDIDTDKVGSLVNDVMDSEILRPIVVDKVADLFKTNGVKHDKDEADSLVNLKESIEDVEDWKVELKSIKEMLNVEGTNYTENVYYVIENTNRYNKITNGYEQNDAGEYLKVDNNYYKINNEEKFDRTGVEGSYTYNQNNEGNYLRVSNVEKMFATIESSDLLRGTRANLLLKAINTIKVIDGKYYSDVTVNTLAGTGYTYEVYDDEVSIIVKVSKNKSVFDSIQEGLEVKTMDTASIGGLLDNVMDSIIFDGYAEEKIVSILTGNGVKHDEDEEGVTTELSKSVRNVEDWKKELDIVKYMLNMTSDTFNNEENGKTLVEIMFDKIHGSALLNGTRANLLLKAVETMNIEGVSGTGVTVSNLTEVKDSTAYYQYNKEVELFKKFARNKDSIDGLKSVDITTLEGENKTTIIGLLEALEDSLIFATKYESTVDGALSTVKQKTLSSYNFVTFKTAKEARDVNWSTEIDKLLLIKNNIATVSGYTAANVASDRDITLTTIGNTLDTIETSSFLGATVADKIADEIISVLTEGLGEYKVTDISKTEATWKATFDKVLQSKGV